MALRRLSMAHCYLRATGKVRLASRTTESVNIFGKGKPMCPGNAFTLFLKAQPRDGKNLKKYVYEAACKWNTLPKEEKSVFQLQAKELEKRYQQEISEWEVMMEQSGHGNLVQRQRQLTEGKNLAIQRSRHLLEHLNKESIQTVDEKEESLEPENLSHIKEAVKEDKSLVREAVEEEEEALIEGAVKEDESCVIEAVKNDLPVQDPDFISSKKPFSNRSKQKTVVKARSLS
ncbi:hypothetical protein GWK47_004800 [Chionoecetes opilio]|uniref:HMG box domain-containing protein n=1 Tax=Chionoecetes opilio TaxID=41210 RepID=A0A8J4YKK3_CHIOP|nr:hypothetical protein GWK47_004800 [Chionoecetes opilio]